MWKYSLYQYNKLKLTVKAYKNAHLHADHAKYEYKTTGPMPVILAFNGKSYIALHYNKCMHYFRKHYKVTETTANDNFNGFNIKLTSYQVMESCLN